MASLKKNTTYSDLGFRVDANGVATDLKTGRSLSRKEVDKLLAGTDLTNFKHRRGGVAGSFDRNKQWMVPAAEILAGVLAGPWAGAAVGGLAKGFDQKGKSGIHFGAGDALRGGIEGYGLGSAGAGLKAGIQAGMGAEGGLGAKMAAGGKEGLRVALGGKPTDAAAQPTTVAGYGANPAAGSGASVAPPIPAGERALLTPRVANAVAPSGGSMFGNAGKTALNAAGKAGDWMQKNPTIAVNMIGKGLDAAFPSADKTAEARFANSRSNQTDFETQRMKDFDAANKKFGDTLRQQLAAIMSGQWTPTVAQSVYRTNPPLTPVYGMGGVNRFNG